MPCGTTAASSTRRRSADPGVFASGNAVRQDGSAEISTRRRLSLRWHSESFRALLIQAVFLALVLGLIGSLILNTLANLESRGISTGFGFLTQEAGFGIIQTLIDYSETASFARVFVVGLLNTLLVSFLGILLATLLGFLIGIARLSSNWLVSRIAAAYIEIFRNIPLLLQIFFWYHAVLSSLPHPRRSHSTTAPHPKCNAAIGPKIGPAPAMLAK